MSKCLSKIIHPIGRNRLNGVIKRHVENRGCATEGRGGDRIGDKNESRKMSVRQFIKKLRATESHYGRKKSVRLYLPIKLKNITNLCKIYNSTISAADLKVGYSFFSRIFRQEFNIGFSSPACDTCTTCDSLRNQLRVCSTKDKIVLLMQLRVHKLRAKTFYASLKNIPEKTYSIVFDLQQVQSLPRVTCQEAFYSRQLSLYNFGLHDQVSLKNYSYTWMENEASRGSNEISSAVFHYLKNIVQESESFESTIKTVRLVSDGCGGQNKNNIVVGMAVPWLAEAPTNIDSIELLFPVRGHSFLPCDRLFGRIEKELKTNNTILEPKRFHEIFSHHCDKVFHIRTDWFCDDWKTATSAIYKPVKNIQEGKRIIATRTYSGNKVPVINVRCESSYKCDVETPVNLLKKGKKHSNIVVNRLPSSRPINPKKLKDIHKLLHVAYGAKWKDLPGVEVYLNLETSANAVDDTRPGKECDCADNDIAFRI